MFICSSPLSQILNDTVKSAQAASEIKSTLQQIYINKFNRKLKSIEKDAASLKKKSSKPWLYSPRWKKFMQRLKMPQKISQQQEKFLTKQIMPPTFPLINNQNKNVDLSPDLEIIKITTVVEAIRQKRQNSAQMLEAAKKVQKIIGKKRSKRSSYESGNNSPVTKHSRRARQEKTFVSSKKSRYPKSDYRKQRTKNKVPTRKRRRNENAAELKTVNNAGLPSTVFYKRIWEYINGTRPHSEIISDYNPLKDNSTCKDRITALQEDKLQVTNAKPEREFYKRIWDIINATHANSNARSKRNANISRHNAATTPALCAQEGTINYDEDKQVQAINEKILSEDPGPYISGFWAVANKTEWKPEKIPVVNIAKLNNNPILSSLVNSASEVDDLNKLPDKVKNVDYSSSDNSTAYTDEARNSSQEIITEPGPPYSSEESFATSSFSPTESAVDKPLREKDRAGRAESYSTGTTPDYDPLKIPYVEVPDYTDQQEDSLDKGNRSATAARYKEYDDSDYDYGPERLRDAGDFSSKSPSAEIKVVQTESTDEPGTALNTNNSRSSCTESEDSAECVDRYDVEDTKLRNNTEDVTDDVHRSAEGSAESASSEENESSGFVDFEEFKKPINWEEFFKNDPILESIRATFSEKYDRKEDPNRTEESEEAYATDPKEQSHDYFTKNENFRDDYAFDDTGKAKEEIDSYAKAEAKESEATDKDYYPYDDKDFFKYTFEKDSDKESDYKENPDRTKRSEEVEIYATDPKEHKENRTEESEELKTYATDPKEQTRDYFAKNENYYNNDRIVSDDRGKANDREEVADFYAKQEGKESDINNEDYYPYDDKDFFKHIFEKDNDKESSDQVDRENDFLSRYFTKDVLRQLQDNSTAEEDRQREESRNRENIHKTLSRILHKKDQFSRLDDNLNKMIEKGEAIPIKYNNFWSLEYESPRKRNENNEEETENSKEKA